jgi:hypothetical protein
MDTTEKIAALAALVLEQTRDRLARQYSAEQAAAKTVRVVPGLKYTKIDLGDHGSMAGHLMVELATGNVYGIKAYGKVHKGHQYGTLDTTGDFYWGDFYPVLVTPAAEDAPAAAPKPAEAIAPATLHNECTECAFSFQRPQRRATCQSPAACAKRKAKTSAVGFYRSLIAEKTGITDPDALALIEEFMRVKHPALDGLSRSEFTRCARKMASAAREVTDEELAMFCESFKLTVPAMTAFNPS